MKNLLLVYNKKIILLNTILKTNKNVRKRFHNIKETRLRIVWISL
jgi:hypothetical protein